MSAQRASETACGPRIYQLGTLLIHGQFVPIRVHVSLIAIKRYRPVHHRARWQGTEMILCGVNADGGGGAHLVLFPGAGRVI